MILRGAGRKKRPATSHRGSFWWRRSGFAWPPFLQFTLPGAPTVYYGDEVGLVGYADPFNRGTYPWGREDEELLAHYRRLGQLRRDNPALRVQPFPSSLRLTAGWALSGAGTVRWRNG